MDRTCKNEKEIKSCCECTTEPIGDYPSTVKELHETPFSNCKKLIDSFYSINDSNHKSIIESESESPLILHAKREFLAVGYDPVENCEDDPNKWIQQNVLELLSVFSAQGHSGFSAPFCISYFEKLAKFEPLCPLTGDDSEWNDLGGGSFQNNRCSHVFKSADRFNGQAYDIQGKVFIDKDGSHYTCHESHVPITFPYTPKTEYVVVDENGNHHSCAGTPLTD